MPLDHTGRYTWTRRQRRLYSRRQDYWFVSLWTLLWLLVGLAMILRFEGIL